MDRIAGMPFAELVLDKSGNRGAPGEAIVPPGITDLIVISHGWKNDAAFATTLYETLLYNLVAASGGMMPGGGGRVFGVTGVFWPAFRFKSDLSFVQDEVAAPGGVGGAAAAGDGDISLAALAAEAKAFAEEAEIADIDDFVTRAKRARGGGGAADAFLATLRAAIGGDGGDAELRADHAQLLDTPGAQLVEALTPGIAITDIGEASADEAHGAGSALGWREWAAHGVRILAGGKSAVATILNQATYFEMKKRAGVVGRAVGALIERDTPAGVRVHFIGHSFGARLVTAACANFTSQRPSSLTLLQGAFSHNGFGTGVGDDHAEGAFRAVVTSRRIDGPILITHTHNDRAVGLFYALASKVSGDRTSGVGGPGDPFGGIGANGAQSMLDGEVAQLTVHEGQMPAIGRDVINNVRCDTIISDHMNVTNQKVAALVWRAIA